MPKVLYETRRWVRTGLVGGQGVYESSVWKREDRALDEEAGAGEGGDRGGVSPGQD